MQMMNYRGGSKSKEDTKGEIRELLESLPEQLKPEREKLQSLLEGICEYFLQTGLKPASALTVVLYFFGIRERRKRNNFTRSCIQSCQLPLHAANPRTAPRLSRQSSW